MKFIYVRTFSVLVHVLISFMAINYNLNNSAMSLDKKNQIKMANRAKIFKRQLKLFCLKKSLKQSQGSMMIILVQVGSHPHLLRLVDAFDSFFSYQNNDMLLQPICSFVGYFTSYMLKKILTTGRLLVRDGP